MGAAGGGGDRFRGLVPPPAATSRSFVAVEAGQVAQTDETRPEDSPCADKHTPQQPSYTVREGSCEPGTTCVSAMASASWPTRCATWSYSARDRGPYAAMYVPEHACTHPTRVDVPPCVRSWQRGVGADIGRGCPCVAYTPPITGRVRQTSPVHGVAHGCARRCTTVYALELAMCDGRWPRRTGPSSSCSVPRKELAFYLDSLACRDVYRWASWAGSRGSSAPGPAAGRPHTPSEGSSGALSGADPGSRGPDRRRCRPPGPL